MTPDWLQGETVSVVIPALNEAANLPHVLPRIPQWVHQVVLVDDGSVDGTAEAARRLLPRVEIIQNSRGRGKGNALRTGFEYASGSFIIQLDADGSEAPEEIVRFVAALLSGADVAKGTRFAPGGGTSDMTSLRKYGNRSFLLMCRALFGVRWTDFCHGYIAFRADALDGLELDAEGFDIEAQICLRAFDRNLRICEVPTYESARINGEGHLLTWPDGWRVLKTIGREKRLAVERRQRAATRVRFQDHPTADTSQELRVNGAAPLGLPPPAGREDWQSPHPTDQVLDSPVILEGVRSLQQTKGSLTG